MSHSLQSGKTNNKEIWSTPSTIHVTKVFKKAKELFNKSCHKSCRNGC